MNKFLAVLITGLSLFPFTSKASQSAEARIYCLSLEFQRGNGPFNLYTLDLSSYDPQYFINGEVAPLDYGYTHGCYFGLNDPTGYDPMVGLLDLNVPTGVDANGNGFDDFFESSQSVSATTTGSYSIPGVASGSVQLQWSRPAGSKDGTCIITLGSLGAFTHSFTLLEYTGPLSYTPGSSTVTGSLDLTQTGLPMNHLQGPVTFKKSTSDPFNLLQLQAGTWTNSSAQLLNFSADLFLRESSWPTNYYGYVTFNDGNPNTPLIDYQTWMLSIDDANDRNNNGIPDFSDNLSTRKPMLALSRTLTNLQLSISGDLGTVCDLQEISSLSSTNWQAAQSLTLTNDPHILLLPLPAAAPSGAPKFWRLLAH